MNDKIKMGIGIIIFGILLLLIPIVKGLSKTSSAFTNYILFAIIIIAPLIIWFGTYHAGMWSDTSLNDEEVKR